MTLTIVFSNKMYYTCIIYYQEPMKKTYKTYKHINIYIYIYIYIYIIHFVAKRNL